MTGGQKGTLHNNLVVLKYDLNGLLLWSTIYDNPSLSIGDDAESFSIAVDSIGDVVVVGSEYRSDLGQGYNWFVRKYRDQNRVKVYLSSSAQTTVVNQALSVTMTLSNTGLSPLTNIGQRMALSPITGNIALLSAPFPSATLSLAPGDATVFTATYQALQPGTVRFTVTVTGTDMGNTCTVNSYAHVTVVVASPSAPTTPFPPPNGVWITSTTGTLPFRPNVGESGVIRVNPRDAGTVRVRIFSLLWETVAAPQDGAMSPGPHEFRWDGQNRQGHPVAAGTYLIEIEMPGVKPLIKRIVLAR